MTAASEARVEKKVDEVLDRLTRLEERGASRDREQAVIAEYTRSGLERLEKRLDSRDLVQANEYAADKRTAEAERKSLAAEVAELKLKDEQRDRDAAKIRLLIITSFVAPVLVAIIAALVIAAVLGGS